MQYCGLSVRNVPTAVPAFAAPIAKTASGGGTSAPSEWSKAMNEIDTGSALPTGTSTSLSPPAAVVTSTWGTPPDVYDVTVSASVSPSMSPLMVATLVAPAAIRAPVAHVGVGTMVDAGEAV